MIRIARIVITTAMIGAATMAQGASIVVAHSDLDLNSVNGRETLNARVERAARRVCAPEDANDVRKQMASRACYRNAVSSAQTRIAALVAVKVAAK